MNAAFEIPAGDPARRVADRVSDHAVRQHLARFATGSLRASARRLLHLLREAQQATVEPSLLVKRAEARGGASQVGEYWIAQGVVFVVLEGVVLTCYARSRKYALTEVMHHRQAKRQRGRRR